jgi:hypothetical protein
MNFIIITVIIVAFSSVVLGGIEKFKFNNVPLTTKQKLLFPIITLKLILIHFNRFVYYFFGNRELSIYHLKFMTINLPITFGCLIEIVISNDLEMNTINWVDTYINVTQKVFHSRTLKGL